MAGGHRVMPFLETLCTALDHLFIDEVGPFGQFVVSEVREKWSAAASTQKISLGKPGDLSVAKVDPRSRNELDQLALATERLRISINMAIQRLTKRSS